MNALTLYTKVADREAAIALVEAATVLIERGQTYNTIESDEDAKLLGEFRARVNKHVADLEVERLEMTKPLREAQASLNAEFAQAADPLKALRDRADTMLRQYLARMEAERQARIRAAEEAQREAERKAREEQERLQREADDRRRQEQARLDAIAEEANRKAAEEAAAKGQEAPPPVVAEVAPEPIVAEVMPAIVSAPIDTGRTHITGTFGSRIGTAEKWTWRITDIKKVPERYLVEPEKRVNRAVLTAEAKSKKGGAKVPGIEFFDEGRINSTVRT